MDNQQFSHLNNTLNQISEPLKGNSFKKECLQCNGTKRYMETSSIDSMFSELSFCRKCDENGMVDAL